MTKEERNQFEKLLAVLSLGLCVAIKNKVIEIDEAEQLLYSPLTMKKLSEVGANKEIIDLIHTGTELEDIESLIQSELANTLSQMEEHALQFLSSSPKIHPQRVEKWISQYLREYVMPSLPSVLSQPRGKLTKLAFPSLS
jgi:hypothetical protein